MARYKRLPTGYIARRKDYLKDAGFEDFEIQELTQTYTTFRRNPALGQSDPAIYLQKMISWRRLYVGNLKRAGYTEQAIHIAILNLYDKKDWLSEPEGFIGVGQRRDPLKMLRQFRKESIVSGSYRRPPKKGSHHALKRRDIDGQKKRRQRNPPRESDSGSTWYRK